MLSRHLRLGTLVTTMAVLAFAAPAAAQEESGTVPPDNSAATQYTEVFPTAGGNRDVYGHDRRRTPREALGARKARELERRGPAGGEVAKLVAETAPAGASYETSGVEHGGGGEPGSGAGAAGRGAATNQGDVDRDSASGTGNAEDGGVAGGDSASGATTDGDGDASAAKPRTAPAAIDGSSGIGSAVSAALGSSEGNGTLLPLALLLTALWALLYGALRGRRTAE